MKQLSKPEDRHTTVALHDSNYIIWYRAVYVKLLGLGIEDKDARRMALNQVDLYEDNFSAEVVAEIAANNYKNGIEVGWSQMCEQETNPYRNFVIDINS